MGMLFSARFKYFKFFNIERPYKYNRYIYQMEWFYKINKHKIYQYDFEKFLISNTRFKVNIYIIIF